jgi:hypothetical protein
VFRFLLHVKRAQIDIQQCWVLQMQYKKNAVSREEMTKWQLRTHMAFLVDNLQYYLQVNILFGEIYSIQLNTCLFISIMQHLNVHIVVKNLPSI